jgi:crotonobetainyl-CoA:carnitine CoA-transferase CaiB-like acyl-CoA transferase
VSEPVSAPRLLGDLQVIDLSASLAGAFCASHLRRLGAGVTRIDSVWPAAPRSSFLDEHLSDSPIYNEYVNGGKAVIELDLSSDEGRGALKALLATADVLVEDWRQELLEEAGLGVASLRREFPNLIVASVTPFGRTGPRSDWPASDLTMSHGGGTGFATPGLVADPQDHPPIRLGSHQGSFVSGLTAATNICAAVLLRTRDAQGGGAHVDFSCHEAVANTFRQSLGTYAYLKGGLNRDLARGRGAGGTANTRNIRCQDGWINMSWSGVKQWDSLKEMMGNPEWAEDELLATPALRNQNWSVAFEGMESWAQDYDKETLFFLCQANRVPCAPVNNGGDLLESDGLSSRSFWDESAVEGSSMKLPGITSQFEGAEW